MWLTIVVGLAGLAIGFGVGRNPGPFRRKASAPDGDGQLAGDRTEDQVHDHPERPVVSPELPTDPSRVEDETSGDGEPTSIGAEEPAEGGDGAAEGPGVELRPSDIQPVLPLADVGNVQRVAERAQLVLACASLADRLRDRQPALYAVLTRDLASVGVTMRVVDGEPYDVDLYEPVGFEPTADPAEDLRVAETVRVGVIDHGMVVRPPEVIVYRHMEDGHGG